jgi:hypothetical protein
MNERVDAALRFVGHGWAVFALAPRTKIPTKDSKGLYDATVDADRVRAVWVGCPDANVALRCGLAFDVLDVDAHHGGFDTLAELVGGDDVLVACGPCARTPNGGAHFYYLPTGYPNRVGIAPGLDWRGDGGYVAAPPSVTRDGTYTWHVERGETFDYRRPLVPEPGWLRRLLDPPVAPIARNAVPQDPPVRQSGNGGGTRSPAYARAALEREARTVAAAPAGQRNATLSQSTYSLARFVQSGELDTADVVDVMNAAALDAGLGGREIRATINSRFQARGLGKPL